MSNDRVLIIGAGLSGLSLAVHLARDGFKVDVFEQEFPGYGPSGRSAGLLVTIMPEDLLRLVLYSRDFYRSLESRDEPPLLKNTRALWISPSHDCFRRLEETHRRQGLNVSLLEDVEDASEAAGLPLQRASESEVYSLIQEYILDVGSAINRLASTASSLGANIRFERVARVEPGSLRTSKGVYRGIVVVAAGAWSSKLLGNLTGVTVEYRCQIASIEGARPSLPVEDDVLGYYIVPVSSLRSNIGDGSNTVISDPFEGYHTDLEDVYNVIERYAERTSLAWEARLVQAWSAPCNVARDGLPIAGTIDDKLFVLTGFNGAGVSLAPGVAKLLADEIAGHGKVPLKFRVAPDRFSEGGGLRDRPREPYDIC